NYALLELAKSFGLTQLFQSGRPSGQGDDILRNADKNPNSAGIARLAKPVTLKSFAELISALDAGSIKTVIALGSSTPSADKADSLKRAQILALSSHEGPFAEHAKVLLPASSWAESDGTFVNAKGLPQESEKAIVPQGESMPAFRWVAELMRV